jgi:hypothetical protein
MTQIHEWFNGCSNYNCDSNCVHLNVFWLACIKLAKDIQGPQ